MTLLVRLSDKFSKQNKKKKKKKKKKKGYIALPILF